MDSLLFFQDARREQADRVIVCCVSQLNHIGQMVGTIENIVHGRRPVMDKPKKLFFLFDHLDGQHVFEFCGQNKMEVVFLEDLCM